MTILLVKKKKKGFVCFVSCFVLFVFWFCFCIGCRLSIINQHVNSNEGFSCLASCYKYSPIIHGKYDYYFPINKLRLHNTPNASHSMLTSGCPSDFHHVQTTALHAHFQWSTACTHLVVHRMHTSSGPPDAAHPVVHRMCRIRWTTGCAASGGPLDVCMRWTTRCVHAVDHWKCACSAVVCTWWKSDGQPDVSIEWLAFGVLWGGSLSLFMGK